MTPDDRLYRFRQRTLALAEELGSVRAACRMIRARPRRTRSVMSWTALGRSRGRSACAGTLSRASASRSTREAESRNWRRAPRASRSRPSTPCTAASGSPTSSELRSSRTRGSGSCSRTACRSSCRWSPGARDRPRPTDRCTGMAAESVADSAARRSASCAQARGSQAERGRARRQTQRAPPAARQRQARPRLVRGLCRRRIRGLRTRLDALDLEGLRDIVAEHRMDSDRLAMKWKARDRVIGRIIDRVEARTAKGSAFRG